MLSVVRHMPEDRCCRCKLPALDLWSEDGTEASSGETKYLTDLKDIFTVFMRKFGYVSRW
jgi:hypothetical protein